MKTLLITMAAMTLSTLSYAQPGETQNAPVPKTLECFIASNPQDATLQLMSEDGSQVIKEEKALILKLDIKLYEEYNSKYQRLSADSPSLVFQTSASHYDAGNHVAVECDGGGWNFKRTAEGNLILDNVDASGEVKDVTSEEGCGGMGVIKATQALNFVKVTCR